MTRQGWNSACLTPQGPAGAKRHAPRLDVLLARSKATAMPTAIGIYHCRCGSLDFDVVVIEQIGEPLYDVPTMACLDCGIVYIFSDPVRTGALSPALVRHEAR